MKINGRLYLAFILLLTACTSSTPVLPPTSLPPQGYPPVPTDIPSPPTGYPAPLAGAATAVTIIYQNFEIVPAQTTIPAGTLVTFLIKDGTHEPYTSDPAPAFDSGSSLNASATYQFTFQNPGTFTILCRLHSGMKATLVVIP